MTDSATVAANLRQVWERALSRREINGECWLYTKPHRQLGYGMIWDRDRRKHLFVHRVSYEVNVGPIPPNLQIDHLCRVRACFNPAHLEAVTQGENIRRSNAPGSLPA